MRLTLTLILMAALRTAEATVITSTFGPGDTFITLGGEQVGGGADTGNAVEVAVAFTPAIDNILTQIRLAVFSTSSEKGDRDLLMYLSEGAVPAPPVETFATTILNGAARIYSFNSVLRPLLRAGETYWITLTSNDLVDNDFGWNFSDSWVNSLGAERTPRSPLWQIFVNASPAFEISGQPISISSVPEPGTMLAIGSVLLLAAFWRPRSGRKALGEERHDL